MCSCVACERSPGSAASVVRPCALGARPLAAASLLPQKEQPHPTTLHLGRKNRMCEAAAAPARLDQRENCRLLLLLLLGSD